MHFLNLVAFEVLMTFKRPWRLRRLFDGERRRSHLRYLRLHFKIGESWSPGIETGGFERRDYSSYEDYLEHQRDKCDRTDLTQYDADFRQTLLRRLDQLDLQLGGMKVLCLAARIGTEVKSFLDLGSFAVGIDLNPGSSNRYVLHGDFHDLQFATGSVDLIFTNSLDHVYDLEKVLAEAHRVLRQGGLLIVEAALGTEGGIDAGFYESFWWKNIDQLIEELNACEFEMFRRSSFESPWPGEQICFRKLD